MQINQDQPSYPTAYPPSATLSETLFPYWRDKSYLVVTLTHFMVDVLNSGRTLLMAILAVALGLTNAQVGIYLLFYNVGNALSQPLFGWLADRYGARWLVVGGLGWMISFYATAALASEQVAVIALTVASLGSGAFHPSGTKIGSQISETRRTQATAIFFMAGQVGLFIGPIAAGGMLGLFDRPGYVFLPLLALLPFLGGWRWLVDQPPAHHHETPATKTDRPRPVLATGRLVLPLVIVIIAYNTVSFTILNFAPKLFTELGYEPGYVGYVPGLFMLGSAVGGIVGGSLADRIGGKWVILLAMIGVIAPVYLYIPAGNGWRLVYLLVAGLFGGMPHSILILMAQGMLPGRRALASGLTLGFMFMSGALGSYVLGVIADQIGLAVALQDVVILPAIALIATLFLPSKWQ